MPSHLQAVREYNTKSVMNIGVISLTDMSDTLYLF